MAFRSGDVAAVAAGGLAGSSAGQAGATATLSVIVALAASSAGNAGAQGQLAGPVMLSGSSAGVAGAHALLGLAGLVEAARRAVAAFTITGTAPGRYTHGGTAARFTTGTAG